MKTSRFHPGLVTVLRTAALALLALLLCLLTVWSQSLNTTTTFQGTLNLEGTPANGTFDILYRVVATAGADSDGVSGPTRTNRSVLVSQGMFTTEIEIPPYAIDWPQRFLDLQIRPSGDGPFQSLAPRLPITPVPAALVADTARAVSAGAVTATALGSNVITTASLADGAVTAAKVGEGQLLRSLNGLTDDVVLEAGEGLTLTTVGKKITLAVPGLCVPWCLYGNVGTTPAPAQTVSSTYPNHHFLGTRDNRVLELRANRLRALRIEPAGANFAPNLLGGYGMNVAAPGTRGGTIGGGGAINAENELSEITGFGQPHFTTIGGGLLNRISSSTNATISGGNGNAIERSSPDSTISGGSGNRIQSNSGASAIGGGRLNYVGLNSWASTISGGESNLVESASTWSAIGGGFSNRITTLNVASTIGGGATNSITHDSQLITIGGGGGNRVGIETTGATIGGGYVNDIGGRSHHATIGGGTGNQVQSIAPSATIAGGSGNVISGGAFYREASAIGGGRNNSIWDAEFSTIGGGTLNTILGGQLPEGKTIGGGVGNTIEGNAEKSTIGGGTSNEIKVNSSESTIGGGGNNVIDQNSPGATIGGGQMNFIGVDSEGATISGGRSNRLNLLTDYSTISGGTSNEIGFLTTHSVIGGGQMNDISDDSNLATIGGGGENKIGAELQGATVGGGQWNNIGARAHHSTISGGAGNQIEPVTESSVIAGGRLNLIEFAPNDAVNTICGGHANRIRSGEYATIPGGREAYARRYGQLAHASGSFANAGDAQHSIHVLRNITTSTNYQELFLDGASKLLTIPTDSTYMFEVHIAGRSQAGTSAGYQISGVIKNVGGTVSFVGTPVMPVVMEDVASWNVTVTADTANNSLALKASGSPSTTVRWVGTVRTTEVVFP